MRASDIALCPIRLPENRGLGNALRVCVAKCHNDWIARMDSDDVCLPGRFERQLSFVTKHPEIDVVGGNITEFVGNEENLTGRRRVPETNAAIKSEMRRRCPFNHMAVMYSKNSVESSGGYLDCYHNEDYYLWLRMMSSGAVFANVPADLVNVRVGANMSSRRGGWNYFKSEAFLQGYMLREGINSIPRYLENIFIRFCGEVLAPNALRNWLFQFTRESVEALSSESEAYAQEDSEKLPEDIVSYPPFSVAMSVYAGDKAEWFDRALESVVNQSVKPDEIVLVVDGPVPSDIDAVIDKYQLICGGGCFVVIRLAENSGHGNARRTAFGSCKNDIVAIMDSDDVCVSNRFESQLELLHRTRADVVGGDIAEFVYDVNDPVSLRKVPKKHRDIVHYMRHRCPFNQVTVMMRKDAYDAAGGYIDWYCEEDYYLWLRMAKTGARFANTGTVLVKVRVGEGMYSRRGGLRYFKSEKRLQRYMLSEHVISPIVYAENVGKRFVAEVLLPDAIRGEIYRRFARDTTGDDE